MGDRTAIGNGLTVTCGELVEIGPGTMISDRVSLLDQLHDHESWLAPQLRGEGGVPSYTWAMTEPDPVRIGPGCWIGIGVVVLPGVTIGEGCVVGANAVVTRDLPDYSVAAGVPARVLHNSRERWAERHQPRATSG